MVLVFVVDKERYMSIFILKTKKWKKINFQVIEESSKQYF